MSYYPTLFYTVLLLISLNCDLCLAWLNIHFHFVVDYVRQFVEFMVVLIIVFFCTYEFIVHIFFSHLQNLRMTKNEQKSHWITYTYKKLKDDQGLNYVYTQKTKGWPRSILVQSPIFPHSIISKNATTE